jgi:hypothetical protein
MTPADLIERNRQRPFVPFRIHLRDGRSYLIHRHRQILVGRTSVVIGIPPQGTLGPFFEGNATVNLEDIVRLETVEPGQTPMQQTGS